MGIRFRCPNGHKLHVKAFLAGKRGLCPQCGVRLTIPPESDPALVQELKPEAVGEEPSSGGSTAATDATVAVAPTELPSGPPEPEPGGQTPAEPVGTAMEAPAQEEPSPGSDSADASAAEALSAGSQGDPIAEAPHALWYVQPPSGGQYGPASGDIMRTWISEGRVTRDSLVWREGWSDWKLAGPLFPGLVSGPAVATDSEAVAIVTEPAEGSIAERYRRKKSNRTALLVVVLLVVACLILFATLIYVINFMP